MTTSKTGNRRARQLPSSATQRANSAAPAATSFEPLEDRLLMFAPAGSWSQPGGLGSPVALRYSYSNLLNGGLLTTNSLGAATPMPVATIRASIEEALGVWTAVAPLQFTEIPDFGPMPADAPYGGQPFPEIRLGHEFIDGPPTSGFNTLAHSWTPTGSNFFWTGALVGDVHFDNGDVWSAPVLTEVAAHELGHAVGLDHPNAANITVPTPALMDGLIAGNFGAPGTSFLFADDVNGIRADYGAGLGWVLDSSGVLHVNGTGGGDVITLTTNNTTVTVTSAGNGSFTRSLQGVNGIRVMARGGNDVINIDAGPGGIPITVTGDAGNDTLNVAAPSGNLAAAGGLINFDGGTGADAIFLNDAAGPASSTYTINSASALRGGWSGIVHSRTEAVTLRGAGGNCTYNVNSVASGTTLSLSDGPGADVVNLAPSGLTFATIEGTVSFAAAGASGNSVNLFDQNDPYNDSYTLTSNSVSRSAAGKVTWQGSVSSLVIRAGNGGNDFDLLDSSVPDLQIYAGGGYDRLLLSRFAGFVNSITGAVYFDGGAGSDLIYVNDSTTGSITDADWTLDGNSLDKSTSPAAGAMLSWAPASVETLTLYGGQWGTHYSVRSLPAGMTANLNAGGGNDTFDIGSPVNGARNVDGIQGTLFLSGQAGANVLNYNDADNHYTPLSITWPGWPPPPPARGDSYTLNGNTVRRDRSAPVNYYGVQTVNVYGGTAPNDFYVTPSALTTFNVNGNSPTPAPFSGTPTSGEWDRITVDFSNTTNPVLTYQFFGGAGTYSFGDRMPVGYTDMEFNNAPATVYMAPPVVVDGTVFSTTPIRSLVLA